MTDCSWCNFFLVGFYFLICLNFCFQVWLPAAKGKGLEVSGTFWRRQKQIFMELTFSNKAMQPMTDFGIQLNKNRYSLYSDTQGAVLVSLLLVGKYVITGHIESLGPSQEAMQIPNSNYHSC